MRIGRGGIAAVALVAAGAVLAHNRWGGQTAAQELREPQVAQPPTAPTAPTPTPTPPGPTPPAVSGAAGPAWWKPKPRTAWQWQLTTPVDQRVNVPVFDIDGFENSAGVVKALHAKGRMVICYVEVGAAENFRPDYRSFPAAVLGKPNGWHGERWVDIRRLDVVGPIIAKRFDMCRAKGFDAVEPDLMDHYSNNTGFPIRAADQLKFNRMVARLAHERGLAVALKNDAEQAATLAPDFDFAVVEECAQFDECDAYAPFIKAGKAVFHVEYALKNANFCAKTRALGLSSMRKNLALDPPRWPC